MKKVLVLGAGLVAGPTVQYLLDHGFAVTVVSIETATAEALIKKHPNGRALVMDVKDKPALTRLISEHDLTVSLLPATMHVMVAEICIAEKKHLVTASYVKPEMQALFEAAKKAGILLLNEIGLDPGIDHMSAMEVIHSAAKKGGKVVEFSSSCGGLPAPDANDNPLGYKFSWSPRGVLLAARNSARFLKDGLIVEIPGEELFDHCQVVKIGSLGDFEVYPNRNSLDYIDIYGLHEARSVFRGTIRNLGHCESWRKMADFGLFDDKPQDAAGLTYKKFMARLICGDQAADPKQALAVRYGAAASAALAGKLEWLGMFTDEAVPEANISPLDLLLSRMLKTMMFRPGERDMVILQDVFMVEYPNRKERITCDLIDFGIPHGDSSMSRTVGLPVAIATRFILEGKINMTGVQVPVKPEIYVPVMQELARLGIRFEERIEVL